MLEPVPEVALPPVESDGQRGERALWMARDVAQTANNRRMCERNEGLANLIRKNNEAAAK